MKVLSIADCESELLLLQILVSLNPHSQPSLIGTLSGVWFSNVLAYWMYCSDEQSIKQSEHATFGLSSLTFPK